MFGYAEYAIVYAKRANNAMRGCLQEIGDRERSLNL